MKSYNFNQVAAALSCAVLSSVASTAFAVQSWNFAGVVDGTTTSTAGACSKSAGSTAGNSLTCNGAVSAEVRGFGTTVLNSSASTFATSYLSNQGANGLGMTSTQPSNASGLESTTSPDHAIDSIGNTELISLKFTATTVLETVTLGWSSQDSDFSVLAWLGGGTPDLNITVAGKTPGQLLSSGWTLIGKYGDADAAGSATEIDNDTNRTITINSGGYGSSYWLIGAFNSNFGGPALDGIGDAWKLLSVAGTPGAGNKFGVPEPTSLALVGVALFGVLGVRRLKQERS